MIPIPADYRMTPKEKEYLGKLEAYWREGVPLTPGDFAKQLGLRGGRSSFRRYDVLKRALNIYGWMTQPKRMRGDPPPLLDMRQQAEDPRVGQLEKKVAELRAELDTERRLAREEAETLRALAEQLRGVLSFTLAHFVGNNLERGQEIERKIVQWAKRVAPESIPQGLPDDAKRDLVIRALLESVGIRGGEVKQE